MVRKRYGKSLQLGCWNIRTLQDKSDGSRPERRTALVALELARYNIDLAALSETRLTGQGKLHGTGSGYTFYWIGYPEEHAREHGVGFALSDDVRKLLVDEPMGITPRFMKLRPRIGRNQFATVFSVYGRTMSHSTDTKEEFYAQLSQLISKVPGRDRLFLLGDFNARVGRNTCVWGDVIGLHGIGTMNENGEHLLSMCAAHSLAITNTRFQQKDTRVTTCVHLCSHHHHLIDYVIVRRCDLPEVLLTRAMRGAECGTDHVLVRSRIRAPPARRTRHTAANPTRKLNLLKLRDPQSVRSLE